MNHNIGEGVRLRLGIHSFKLLSERLDFILSFSHDLVDLVLGLGNLAVVAAVSAATTAAVDTNTAIQSRLTRRRVVLVELDLIFDVVSWLAVDDARLYAKHDRYGNGDEEDKDRSSRVDGADVISQVRMESRII